MAGSLKLRVVAEGVETVEQADFLRAQACDQAQGYYFSRPVIPELFASLLQTGIN
jgi:EAL domain-containing protein (putative c-di-GMP-specific phosphodiesterase class I)